MSELVRLTQARFTKDPIFHKLKHQASTTTNFKSIFTNPINFSIPHKETWAIIGNSQKTEFLKILSGSEFAQPANSRLYPASSANPKFSVELLRFVNNGNWGHGAHDSSGGFTHLSSRYEFFKDLEVDEKVDKFIADINYNSNHVFNAEKVQKLIEGLNLKGLEDKFITTLSNGQFRRARIAKALYRDAGLLLIDDPFLGLDPIATETVSKVLQEVARSESIPTTLGIGLRVQDTVPDWVEKVAIVDESGVAFQGPKYTLEKKLKELKDKHDEEQSLLERRINEKLQLHLPESSNSGDKIIEMKGIDIKYRGVPALKNLHWEVKDGEKWHVRGRNGSESYR
ncbi:unnamed protein product [Ambrosiozyma monospora]|uniref:Unnamed protein product n=1 Tax=Ambrosiozyma monospora TaxID=43982 RepID=A0ACB5U2K7_AMBMO|nr:unnamed protein product [Ambrosiozyma monospora]